MTTSQECRMPSGDELASNAWSSNNSSSQLFQHITPHYMKHYLILNYTRKCYQVINPQPHLISDLPQHLPCDVHPVASNHNRTITQSIRFACSHILLYCTTAVVKVKRNPVTILYLCVKKLSGIHDLVFTYTVSQVFRLLQYFVVTFSCVGMRAKQWYQ